ncbi:nuclear transport factor 2 family protein [Acrocarpospora catenulata]|uniref:nuclear transport factor 2 family protein n=1 Tax=Acrocarpospora catenulata TaxID=2836182 RepID=UPI00202396A8|nr:nuclear transport factor 2 family protein [Acrocarpospora catenulata]
MSESALVVELRDAERRLQRAQLASDVDELDRLLDDRLVFTLGVDGNLYSKADDLHNHRTRAQILTKVEEEELDVLVDGRVGITWFLGSLAGTFQGSEFEARMRYTRTWIHDDEHGWRILTAHASPMP